MVKEVIFDPNVDPREVFIALNDAAFKNIFPHGVPSLELIKKAMESPDIAICLCKYNDAVVGVFALKWLSPVCIKLMAGAKDGFKGKTAKDVAGNFINYLFNGKILKIVAEVMPQNRPALILASSLGFKREGINRASVLIGKKVYDQIYLGLTYTDWCERHRRVN